MSEEEDKNASWHLSKSIPLTLIFAIACQTVALIWFVASLRSDVDAAARELVRLDARVSTVELISQTQAVLMARMDENILGIRTILEKSQ